MHYNYGIIEVEHEETHTMNDERKSKKQLISELIALRQRIAQLENPEAVRVEEALKESEEKYRSLFQNMLDAYAYHEIVLDENNRPIDYIFLEMNDLFEEYTGLRRDNIVGKRVTEVIPGIENAEPDLISVYGEVALTGKEARFDLHFEPFEKWYSVSVYSPRHKYFVVMFQDITARKQAEEALQENRTRLSLIFDTVSDVIFLLAVEPDDHFRFVSVNQTFLTATGLTEDQVAGKRVVEVLPRPAHALIIGKYKEAIRENKTVKWKEVSAYPTGKLTGEVTITPAWNAAGVCTHLIGSVHDITEIKQAEEALQKLNAELGERVRERTEELQTFVGLMAGREVRMAELKKVIKKLRAQLQEAGMTPVADDPLLGSGS